MSTFWYEVRAAYEAVARTRPEAVRKLRDKVLSEIGVDIQGKVPQVVIVRRYQPDGRGEVWWSANTTIIKREGVEL